VIRAERDGAPSQPTEHFHAHAREAEGPTLAREYERRGEPPLTGHLY